MDPEKISVTESRSGHKEGPLTDLEHATHTEALDFAERVERDLGEFLNECAKRSGHERSRSRRDLGVHEHERQKRVVDKLVNLCGRTVSISPRWGTPVWRPKVPLREPSEVNHTFRFIRLVPVDCAAQDTLTNDLCDVGTLSLDIVVEQDLVELVGHVKEHLDVGSRVGLERCRELVHQARYGRFADVTQVRDRQKDPDILRYSRPRQP